ncbi:hypothetical protein B0T17DRAFT_501023 [Bombardia bombarda]|uniref:Short-chain dehydrogenase n=1 Tax=Bombardia bombarda TaxID=252184 RepID=A0AA39U200_9PEZI|nr:hypothetical protein B0T17DRAFT_501023 [Bombardia bombarda]
MSPYTFATPASAIAADLASTIANKTILTTGVSPGGLGAIFAETIAAASPALLILAGRNTTKIQATADAIAKAHPKVKVKLLELDLGSLAAVRKSAAEVNSWDDVPRIDVLVNNAGIMAHPYKLTPEGFESQFGTNHLGHFLFTNLVMGKLLKSEGVPRVVNVSSDGHRLGAVRFHDYNFDNGETYNKWTAYGQSKSANCLFALSLAEKFGPKLLAFSLHPGVILTNLGNGLDFEADFSEMKRLDKALGNKEGWKEFDFKDHQQGAATHVYAAFEPSLKDHNGAYLQDSQVTDPYVQTVKSWITSKVEADQLWKLSEKLVGETFSY